MAGVAKTNAEQYFRKGLTALKFGRSVEAVAHFEAAIAAEKQRGALRLRMRYFSYYGLSMAVAHRPSEHAIRMCEKAATRDSFDPALQSNLGKVYLLAGKTTQALAAFERGLRLDPTHQALKSQLAKVDRRASPPIPRLDRGHPANIWLGRLRGFVFQQRR